MKFSHVASRPFYCQFAGCFVLWLLLSTAEGARGQTSNPGTGALLRDNVEKMAASARIERGYLAKLQLIGHSAEESTETLLREGFGCAISLPDASLLVPAQIRCRQLKSLVDAQCPTLFVLLQANFKGATRDQLFDQMPESKVTSAFALCPYSPASDEDRPLDEADAAELRGYVQSLMLAARSVSSAYRVLLSAGFGCAFTRSPPAIGVSFELVCRGVHDDHRRCRFVEIVLSMNPEPPTAGPTPGAWSPRKSNALVNSVQARCTAAIDG